MACPYQWASTWVLVTKSTTNDDDVLEAQGKPMVHADVAVSYNGWTLTVDQDGIDNLFDDTDGSQT